MKKAICLLFAMLLVIGLFAGCQTGNNEPSGQQPNQQGGSDETPTKLVMWQAAWAKPQDDASNQRVKEAIDAELGIDLQVYVAPPEGASDKLSIMLSSGDQLDIVVGVLPDLFGGYKDGAVAPLNDLLDQHGQDILKIASPDLWPLVTADDGSILAVPNPTLGDQSYLAVRQDLLAKYNMETPTTLDQFDAFLAKMKEDGYQLFIGNEGFKNPTMDSPFPLRALGGLFMEGGCTNVVYQDGKVVDYIRGDGFKEMLMKLNEWMEAGYIPKDIFSWTTEKGTTAFSVGQIGAYVDWGTCSPISPQPQADFIDSGNPDAYFTYCTPMTGGTTGKNAGTYKLGYAGPVWITQKSQVKDVAMQYLNWLWSDVDHYMLATYGVEGTDWKWIDEETNTYESLTLPEGTPAYEGSYYYFDYYGTRIKNAAANTQLKIFYNLYDFYPKHEENVQKSALANADFGLFGEIDKEYSASDLVAFKMEEIVKFITGQRDFSEWDQFIEQYLALGGQEYDDARNAKWDTVKDQYE